MTCICKDDNFKSFGFDLLNERTDEKDIEVGIERPSNGTLHDVSIFISHPDCTSVNIPIKFCPFCGRKF